MKNTLYTYNGFFKELNPPSATKYVSPAYTGLDTPYFTNIQDAIDDLGTGEGLVIIYPGTYEEMIEIQHDHQHLYFHDGAVLYADSSATGYVLEISADYCSVQGYMQLISEKTEADYSVYLNGIAMFFEAKGVYTSGSSLLEVMVEIGTEVHFQVGTMDSVLETHGSITGNIQKLKSLDCNDISITNLTIEKLTNRMGFHDFSIADITCREASPTSQAIHCNENSNVVVRGLKSIITGISLLNASLNSSLGESSTLKLIDCYFKNIDTSPGGGYCISTTTNSKLLLQNCVIISMVGTYTINGTGRVKYLTECTLNKATIGTLIESITSNKVISTDVE